MDWNDIVIAVFTAIVALSTAVYAFLTSKLVSETQRLREVQTEPQIMIERKVSRDNAKGESPETGQPGDV